MKPLDALRIEGKANLSILCYGIFTGGAHPEVKKTPLGEGCSSTMHDLAEPEWSNSVVLEDVVVPLGVNVPEVVARVLENMIGSPECVAAVCLYDGAFTTYDDLFSADIASQTYAFSIASGEPIIALSSEILGSREWEAIVTAVDVRIE